MPKRLGNALLDAKQLKTDYKSATRIGPCAIGEQALYLNSFFLDRRYYLPISSVRRVYKRIAMSKGGFSGKGIFATIAYFVVEFDSNSTIQCKFHTEEDVDRMIAVVQKRWPTMPIHSEAAEKRLAQRAAEKAARVKHELNEAEAAALRRIEGAQKFLSQYPCETQELSAAAKAKRVNERSNPAYKWVALTIVIGGALALGYGIFLFVSRDTTGLYFFMFGLAAILLFSSANVLPTARNNKKAINERLETARNAAAAVIKDYPNGFPIPARYLHSAVLDRMADIISEGRADSCEKALEIVKSDLKKLNSNVQVDQEEYDQIVLIKPMFLLEDYR